MSVIDDIIKVFDAQFHESSLKKHYEEHTDKTNGKTQLPKGMTITQYGKKAEKLSLQKIDGKRVRAFRYRGNRIGKTNGNWYTAYADGKDSGNVVTCFPASYSDWERWMKRENGVEIFEE